MWFRIVRLTLCATLVIAALAATGSSGSAIPPGCDPTTPEFCEPVITTQTGVRQLTVARSSGAVSSTPTGIDCGSDCTQSTPVERTCIDGECEAWPDSTSFTLSAAGGPSGYSPSWSSCGEAPTCTVHLGGPDVGSDSQSLELTWVDRTAPTTTFAPPAKVGPSNYNVTAAGVDNSGSIARYDWTVDSIAQAPTGSVLSLAGFSHGDHTVTVRAHDAAGNAATAITRTVTVDKAVAVSVNPLPMITNAPFVPVVFTTDPDVVARSCSFDGGAYAACVSGWSGITSQTSDGEHTYRVKVTDDVGNVAQSAALTTEVDRTLPALVFTDGPTDGQEVVTPDVAITFSLVEANTGSLRCRLDAGAFGPCTPETAFRLSALANGTHVFTVEATDTAGNVRTINRTFAVNVPQPPPTSGGAATGTTAGTTTTSGTTTGGTVTPFAPRYSQRTTSTRTLTTFKKLSISSLPTTAKVTVVCKGRGCAFKAKTLRHSGGTLDVLKKLKHIELGPRATLQITVRATDGARSVAQYTTRAGKKPRASFRCAAPGEALGACA